MKKTWVAAMCVVALGIGMAGCKSQPQMSNTPLTGNMNEPQWVAKGAKAFPEQAGKIMCGVGVVDTRVIRDAALQRTAADQRARADVAAQMRTMVQAVFKDYMQAAMTQNMDAGESESLTSNVQKSVVDEVIMGAEPVDHWLNTATGVYYALVQVSMDTLVKQMRDKMIAAEKDRLKVDATAAHEDLDKIIEKERAALAK